MNFFLPKLVHRTRNNSWLIYKLEYIFEYFIAVILLLKIKKNKKIKKNLIAKINMTVSIAQH